MGDFNTTVLAASEWTKSSHGVLLSGLVAKRN
jgi:hypothetical protein